MATIRKYEDLEQELAEVKLQLEEANDVIEAIRTGQIDALIIKQEDNHQFHTLKTADQSYRVFIEQMNEGALTINSEGLILYSNSALAEILKVPLPDIIGHHFAEFVVPSDRQSFQSLFNSGWHNDIKGELELFRKDGSKICALLSLATLELEEGLALSAIVADLSVQKAGEGLLKQRNDELRQARDIAERLNNELEDKVAQRTQELLQSQGNLSFITEYVPVIIWTAAPGGEFNYFNKKWYSYSGLDKQQSEGWGWPSAIHPDDMEHTMIAWKQAALPMKAAN